MPVYALRNLRPERDLKPDCHPTAWIAPNATLIGAVTLAEQASVWFGVVIRADNEPIRIGARSNIQENCVLHVDDGFPLEVGDDVTVGHQAMLHGCTLGANSLIGIQAVVMNGARIGRNCLVGAGALVTEGKVFPDGSLIMGTPAKLVRELSGDEIARIHASAANYAERAALYAKHLRQP